MAALQRRIYDQYTQPASNGLYLPDGAQAREHHVLFHKEEWTSTETHSALREAEGLVVNLKPEAYDKLHSDPELTDGVPLLGRTVVEQVLKEYKGDARDPVGSIENLLGSLHKVRQEAIRSNNAVRKDLADAAILAVVAQYGYIYDGQS